MKLNLKSILLAIATTTFVLGCSHKSKTTDQNENNTPTEAAAAAPTDAEIAHIVVTANNIDIAAGKLAEKMSKNKEVKGFAKTMVRDHSGVNKQATTLVTELGVTPQDNSTSQALQAQADEHMAKLKTLKGKAFDIEYANHEVAYHEAVANALDTVLIPSAKNERLKELMVKVRPAFTAHLEHAKAIQAKLTK